MRKYVIVAKDSGEVRQTMAWGDDRDFPSNITLGEDEEVVTVDYFDEVDTLNLYDSATQQFYILDVTDTEVEIAELQFSLAQLEAILPTLQEETWRALSIDETKLSQVWQDRLNQKRSLRTRLSELGVIINE